MTKKKGVAPEKMSATPFKVRVTDEQRAAIIAKAHAAKITPTDYIRATALDTPLSRVPRTNTASDLHIQKVVVALNKWGEVLQRIYESAQVGDIPYESLMRQLVLGYQELHTAVLEMIEAAR